LGGRAWHCYIREGREALGWGVGHLNLSKEVLAKTGEEMQPRSVIVCEERDNNGTNWPEQQWDPSLRIIYNLGKFCKPLPLEIKKARKNKVKVSRNPEGEGKSHVVRGIK